MVKAVDIKMPLDVIPLGENSPPSLIHESKRRNELLKQM